MGRAPRTVEADVTYHAIARGNNRARIFLEPDDYGNLCEILTRVTQRYAWTCHAYCLMPNHLHLAVTTAGPDISNAMRDLLGSYARAFNRRHERTGHVFSSRYRTVLVKDDRQFLTVLRYISRNPMEASLVETPDQWTWSSYPAMIGEAPRPTFLDPHLAWTMFADDPGLARRQLRAFVEGAEPALPLAISVPASTRVKEPERPTIPELLAISGPSGDVDACLAHGYSHAEIARALGISRSAVSQRCRRLRQRETAYESRSSASLSRA